MKQPFIIRQKERRDCLDCASITTRTWRSTYTGIVSDEFLNHLAENEQARATHALETFDHHEKITFVSECEGKVVGLATLKECHRKNLSGIGEIQALYVLPEYQGQKMGTALWNASISYFQDCGYPKMVVGCLEKNPNRVFYQKKNGKEIGTAKFELTGEPLRENLYLYDISLSSVENILTSLQRSSFRRKFHLRAKEKQYVKQKGIDVIYHHACDFIRERLACAEPIHDGKQTPMKGHPVFLAQHATATCCRGCLEKWHHIPKHRALTEEEIQYIVRVIMRWIQKERVI